MATLLQQQRPAQPAQTPDQFIASKMDAIRFGTPEEAAAAWQEVSAAQNPRVDENSLIVKAAANIKHDGALAAYNSEFADVLATPNARKLSGVLVHEKLSPFMPNGKPNWTALGQLDWQQFYRTIGNELRSTFGKPSQPAPTPAAVAVASGNPSQPDKEARKASIVNLPTAAGARAELPAEEKPQTREQILAQARKARGLPTG